MLDRVPASGKANRIKITLDDGTEIEGVLSYADDATQEGSYYNKANVLPDEVCTMLGIDTSESEPKDAFTALGGKAFFTGYASDFWLYMCGEHPVLNANTEWNDYKTLKAGT